MIGYKYRANAIEGKDSTRDIESLLNDEIWASSFRNLNDPFEATYTDEISKCGLTMLILIRAFVSLMMLKN